jgi:excisionase family DNA binding protein
MAKSIPEKNVYCPDELAAILDVEHCSVYRWIRLGQIEHLHVGKRIRIAESEMVRVLRHGVSGGLKRVQNQRT